MSTSTTSGAPQAPSHLKDIMDGMELLRMEGFSHRMEAGATSGPFRQIVMEALDEEPARLPHIISLLGQPVTLLPDVPGAPQMITLSGLSMDGALRKFFILPEGEPAYETVVEESQSA
jgi:hypothetical protein